MPRCCGLTRRYSPRVGIAVRRARRGEAGVVVGSPIRVSPIATVLRELEVPQPVRLHQPDLVVILVSVARLVLVDVTDQQAAPWKLGIVQRALAILQQEVLWTGRPVLPNAVDVPARLHIGNV